MICQYSLSAINENNSLECILYSAQIRGVLFAQSKKSPKQINFI